MSLSQALFGKRATRVAYGYVLSIDDLARLPLPDEKLLRVEVKFTRSTPVGCIPYSLVYYRAPVVEFDNCPDGPHIYLSSHQSGFPLPALPAYTEDFLATGTAIAKAADGFSTEVKENVVEIVAGRPDFSSSSYIVLRKRLTKEGIANLVRNESLRAENANIQFVRFRDVSWFESQFKLPESGLYAHKSTLVD